jgi:Zn-dependent protease
VTDLPPYGEQRAAPAPSRAPNPLRRYLAPLVAAALTVGKWGAVVIKLKFFTLVASMLASLGGYAWLYGWKFAVGFVLLILVHELGHVVALRARGIEAGLPVFLPFLGAFVSMKESPRTAYDEAVSGIAGPVAGVAASFAVLGLAEVYDTRLLYVLAFTGFFLNLFNLLPVIPLDGGRTVAALSPALWGVGLVGLLAYEVWRPSPIIPIILVLGAFEGWRRWRGRNEQAARIYYTLTADQRWRIGASYLGLIAVILWAMHEWPLPERR